VARVAALIPAAGEGARLGLGPKAFVDLEGESLLSRAVGAFERSAEVDEVLVGVPSAMCTRAEAELRGRARVVVGGGTRQESVYNLLRATDAEVVLIHDAARPFLEGTVIAAVLGAVQAHGAASVVVPVADTLLEADTGARIDRVRLRAVQTPQGFAHALILEAHERAVREGFAATDDAGLVRQLGAEVALVEGSPWLMKVTTPADLEVAAALARAWDAR